MSTDDRRADDFEAALLALDRLGARRIFMDGVGSDGALPFMETIVGSTLERIGRRWESGQLALSQIYMAGRMCEELALSVLPSAHPDRRDDPRLAICVFEDYHTLGKRMVHAVLRNEGFAVTDWGRLELDSAAERLRREPVDILLLSCLMLSSVLRIGRLTASLKAEFPRLLIAVGGAPFRYDPDLWREVGADSMGSSATEVGSLIRSLWAASK